MSIRWIAAEVGKIQFPLRPRLNQARNCEGFREGLEALHRPVMSFTPTLTGTSESSSRRTCFLSGVPTKEMFLPDGFSGGGGDQEDFHHV